MLVPKIAVKGASDVASFAGTTRHRADSFCSAHALLRSKKPVVPMLGQIESDGLDAGGSIKDYVMTPTDTFSIRFPRFLPCCSARV